MKTSVSILVAAMLALTGCHHRHHAPTSAAAADTISVSEARLLLPAVKGNPGAGYFTLANATNAPVTLVGVDITGAQKAEMHETSGGTMQPLAQVAIAPGAQVSFAPAGKHVMAFNLVPTLTPGGSSTIVFHFQDGKTLSAKLRIEAAGGGSDDMAKMNMGGMNMGGKN